MCSDRLVLALLLALLGPAACVPTISKPRGEKHLTALAAAEAHQHAGRYEQAAAEYKKAADAAERRVDRDESLYRQSRVLARLDRHAEAIAICDQLASADPPARRTLRARLDASRYRLLTGDEERAERDLLALVLEHPDTGPGKSALRVLLSRHVDGAADPALALAWVRELEAKAGDSATTETLMNVQAELLLAQGQRDQAIAMLESQVERFPYPKGHRWDDALYRLADLALDNGDGKRAIDYLERMIAVRESSIVVGSYTRPMFPKAALRIARIYRDDLKDAQAAIRAYERVRSEFKSSTVSDDALEEEAALRLANGDRDRACSLWQEVLEEHDVGSARRRAEEQVAKHCSP